MLAHHAKKIFFFPIFFLILAPAWAVPGQLTDAYNLITTKAGLSNNKITAILQDSEGYIWIGTEGGLNRYDGYELTKYVFKLKDSSSIAGNNISCLFIDSNNDLWIGTRYNGLSKYNRSSDSFTNYRMDPFDFYTLSHNGINSIAEDKEKNLWIATQFGATMLNIETGKINQIHTDITIRLTDEFAEHLLSQNVPNTLVEKLKTIEGMTFETTFNMEQSINSLIGRDLFLKYKSMLFSWWGLMFFSNDSKIDESIQTIKVDKKGELWLAIPQKGLAHYNFKQKSREYYASPNFHEGEGDGKDIYEIFITDSTIYTGRLWGWAEAFNIEQKTFSKLAYTKDLSVTNILGLKGGILNFIAGGKWMQTDIKTGKLIKQEELFHQKFKGRLDSYNIQKLPIHTRVVYQDKQGNYWIGTNNGLFLIEKQKEFTNIIYEQAKTESISHNDITAMFVDSKGRRWIGHENARLDLFSPEGDKLKTFKGREPIHKLGGGAILSISEDTNGRIYVGTYIGGLQYYDEKTQVFETTALHSDDRNHQLNHDVRAAVQTKDGNLWVTLHGGGVSEISGDSIVGRYRADYTKWKNNLHHDWLISSTCDAYGNLWFGSFEGISMFAPQKNTFISYKSSEPNATLPNNVVNDFFLASDSTLWIATNSGLCYYNYTDSTFVKVSDDAPFTINEVNSIEEDANGNIWFSLNTALVKYSPSSHKFRLYTARDGIRNIQMKRGVSSKDVKGKLLFGGTNGYVSFQPEEIRDNMNSPDVKLSGLKIFHTEVPISTSKNAVLQKHISVADQISLNYDHRIISLEFVALNFIQTEKNRFKYKLEKYDNDWNDVGEKREAHYTNIPPGEYTFRVIASNNDGVWNMEGASIKIVILPAWWMTWWFKTAAALLIVSLLYGYYKYRIKAIQGINRILESKVEERTKELQQMNKELIVSHKQVSDKNKELNEKNEEIETQRETLIKTNSELEKSNSTKVKMLSIIAHDLKNPMGAVIGFSDILAKNVAKYDNDKIQKFSNSILSSAKQTLALLENLLTWARSQTNNIKTDIKALWSAEIVNSTIDLQKLQASKKNIHLHAVYDEDFQIMGDYNTISTIIRNFISNAIKFTPRDGEIKVKVKSAGRYIEFSVIDNGMGMTQEQMDGLFKVESNNSTKGTEMETGTGLGLIICKDFAEKNNGHITVSSTKNAGSSFNLFIPRNE